MTERKPEQKLWDKMRRELREKRGFHVERIENLFSDGMPDTVLLTRHARPITVFTELKVKGKPPLRPTSIVFGKSGLRTSQRNWHLDWRKAGGHSLIIASVGEEIFMLSGGFGDRFNEMTLKEMRECSLAIGWTDISVYLGGPQ